MPTYDIQELLSFRDLEICSRRPENLPPQVEWMGTEALRQESGGRKHEEKNLGKDSLNNHNNEVESQKRPVKERIAQSCSNHENIVLGPPRNSFASSSPQQAQRKNDKTENHRRIESSLARFDNSEDTLREDYMTPSRRRKNENIAEGEEWHTQRHTRKTLGQDDKPKKRGTLNGQSWEKKLDKIADVSNWRNNTPVKDRINERNTEKSKSRVSKSEHKETLKKSKEPEWMESDVVEDTIAQANSADAYERWKEEMKNKNVKQEESLEAEEKLMENSPDDSVDDFIGADKASAENSLFAVDPKANRPNLASPSQAQVISTDSFKPHKPSRFLSKYIGDSTPPVDIENQHNRPEPPQITHTAVSHENLNLPVQNLSQSHPPPNEGSHRLMSILTGGRPAEQDYFQDTSRYQVRPTEMDDSIHPQSYLNPSFQESTPRSGFFHSLLQQRTPPVFPSDGPRIHSYESERLHHPAEPSLDRSPFPSPGYMPPPGLRGPEPFNRPPYGDMLPGMHQSVRSIHPSSPMSPPAGPHMQFGTYQQSLPPQYPPHQYMMSLQPQFRGNLPHYMNGPPIHPQAGNQVYRPGPIPPPGLEQYPVGMQNRR